LNAIPITLRPLASIQIAVTQVSAKIATQQFFSLPAAGHTFSLMKNAKNQGFREIT
jgi:hypothetical protein